MKDKRITPTIEDYLRAIYYLGKKRDGGVGVVTLAKYMRLAKSTVSERLKNLDNHKLINYKKYSSIIFTNKGYTLASQLTYKHRLIEVFLHEALKMSKNNVHREAHKLEHAFSDEVITRLSKFLGYPKKDPHGKPITHKHEITD
ncbi:metal-dependent transcriptional regulator [Patescibacteria group bacterium]|nr:metal-dependent transcriptional regulator [Patescibacteria group bacterium]